MPEPGDGEQEERSFVQLPREDITAEEYSNAFQILTRFVEQDVNETSTFEQLTQMMKPVGDGLRAVVLSNGQIEERQFVHEDPERGEIRAVDRAYVIRKLLEGGPTIYATADMGRVQLGQYTIEDGNQLNDFRVVLPYDREINISGIPAVDKSFARATDWRGREIVNYFPTEEPNNPTVLRGYARVVQEGVMGVLFVSRVPTLAT